MLRGIIRPALRGHLSPGNSPFIHVVSQDLQVLIIKFLIFIHLKICSVRTVIHIGTVLIDLLLRLTELLLGFFQLTVAVSHTVLIHGICLGAAQHCTVPGVLRHDLAPLIFDGAGPVSQLGLLFFFLQFLPRALNTFLCQFQHPITGFQFIT